MQQRHEITLPRLVVVILSLDDTVMQKEQDVRYVRNDRRTWTFSVTRESGRLVLADLFDRAEVDGVDMYDQPRSWRYACRKALPALRDVATTLGMHAIVRHVNGGR